MNFFLTQTLQDSNMEHYLDGTLYNQNIFAIIYYQKSTTFKPKNKIARPLYSNIKLHKYI